MMEIKNSRRQHHSKQQNKHDRRRRQNQEKENNLKISNNVSEVEESARMSISGCDRTSFESLLLLPSEIPKQQKKEVCRTCCPSFAAMTSPWNIDGRGKDEEEDNEEEEKKEGEGEACSSGSADVPPTRCGLCERLQGPVTSSSLDKDYSEKSRRSENCSSSSSSSSSSSEARLGLDGDSESEANKRRRRGRKRELEGGTDEFIKDSTRTRSSKKPGGFPGLFRAIDVGGRWIRCAASVVRWPPPTPPRIGINKTAEASSINFLSTIKNRRKMNLKLSSIKAIIFFITLLNGVFVTSASAQSNKIIDDGGGGNGGSVTTPIESSPFSTGIAKRDVCQSVDVRNSVNQFSRLEGCRVVEGFVQILLIDHANDASYANLTFPDLVEITGYLLLYRVNGLRSVGHLFPNLTVIRGHSLFINYALVAFEMMHLQEIGLHSLTNIVRGSVRFEKNPALCYVDTIDWELITGIGKGEHVISGNKPKNGCPVCEKVCPKRFTKPDETLCWNRQHCQKVCDSKCGDRACNGTMSGECCHPSCLGGCTGPEAKDCSVCREVVVDNRLCVKSCPAGTYEFLNRRCVQENECRKMKKPREAFEIEKEFPYKPFNNSCVTECPAGYMDDEIDGKPTCKKCDGLCLKECSGASVDSIASAQKLRGCTHITGSLEIQIRGGKNIVKELEDSLSMIEEIDGYLKIVRSFPLISLNFLKNLRMIRGNSLESGKYSLVVLDNQNLQELWDKKTVRIMAKNTTVKVFFHFNPKLCLDTIEKFRKNAALPEFTELEVAPNSNGDKVACNVTKLRTRVTKKTSNAALIQWEAFNHHDPRSLLGYVVYTIEAPNNVTMYDGRDACGGDGWRVDDVSAVEGPERPVLPNATKNGEEPEPVYLTHILTQLKPYTQYAFYVKTYTIATERSGAQSDLHYFTTVPDAPSVPRNLFAWSNGSHDLVISWDEPDHKNGNLTHYRIIGRWEPDDRTFLDQRNYCDEPLLLTEKKSINTLAEEAREKALEEKALISTKDGLATTCNCADGDTDPSLREKEVSSSIAFEDALHNQVYIKRPNERRRRDLSETVRSVMIRRRDLHSYPEDRINATEITDNVNSESLFNKTVYGQTNFAIKNLRHYAVYTIEVQACREPVENDTLSNCCSTKSIKTARTLPLETADDIPEKSFVHKLLTGNNSRSTVKLVWEEPPDPNGLIVTYQIEYRNVNIQNVKATVVCIPRREFLEKGKSYYLRDLNSGNYSLRLRATSLAGYGAYTATRYFYIKEENSGGSQHLLVPLLIILSLTMVCIFGGYALKRKFMPNVPSIRLIATVNPEYVSTAYVPDEWEVPRKNIELLRELGNGSFGMVYEGVAHDVLKGKPEVKCAVKTVNENATDRERIEFLNEASVMKAFNTHHVVRLLGVVSQGQPTLVVMELMVNGDLKTYLRSHRPDVCENISKQPPTLKRILQMAIEIADGMSYLAAKKFVHRDLAARNCMVAEDMTVKIGDFGMTRDIYETDYYRKGTKGLLPVRWMAPESLKDGVFTSYSDVWSYGVVLWEMVTLASQPYQGLSNDQVLRYVIDGGVMERPENCPDSLYTLMRQTWNHKPNQRPTFIDIATMLLVEVNVEAFERVSFYHSVEGIEARNQNAAHSPQADKDLEMETLHDLRDDDGEVEGSEESPLRQDFGDFASFEPSGPNSIKISSNPIYGATTRSSDNAKLSQSFNEFNSSKVPLKADFDDFEGASMESLRSSRDTLDLPFAEESLKSVKNSPYVDKRNNSSSRGNISDNSIGKNNTTTNKQHLSPGSVAKRNFLQSPRFSTIKKDDPDYENKTPQSLINNTTSLYNDTINNDKTTNITHRVEFPSIDDIEDNNVIGKDTGNISVKNSKIDYNKTKTECLNNGYIGGKTTQC